MVQSKSEQLFQPKISEETYSSPLFVRKKTWTYKFCLSENLNEIMKKCFKSNDRAYLQKNVMNAVKFWFHSDTIG